MNAQRFIAPSSREAMNKVKMALGDDAVILSSQSTDRGFEVIAAAEEHFQVATEQIPGLQLKGAAKSRLEDRARNQMAPALGRDTSVEQDTEALAMSTLSFQDYVRERMLRKRRELMQPATPVVEPQQRPAAERAVRPTDDVTLPFARTVAPATPRSTPKVAKPAAPVAAVPSAAEKRLSDELSELKGMLEERFNTLAWLGTSRQNPIQSNLMLKLLRAGYSPTVARAVMERLPAEHNAAQAFRWMQEVLIRNLKTASDASALCDEGGVFALIGSTGVGKTTTTAKLAAQCVKTYGANSVGLITLDTYRVAGYEQLRTYGRMLGVVAHLAHDRAALQDLLGLLANKRMVIIDTAGLSQKDNRIQEMLELLASPKIKKLLVLNASSHGDTLDDVLNAYKEADLYGVVLSKLDEAAKLGPAVDALIRHQLVLRGVTTGQRVPEDWQRADAQALVRMSMSSGGKSAFDPQSSELGFYFSQPKTAPVKLEGLHV
jgi:flagellar biosynthesis protein FlhF